MKLNSPSIIVNFFIYALIIYGTTTTQLSKNSWHNMDKQ